MNLDELEKKAPIPEPTISPPPAPKPSSESPRKRPRELADLAELGKVIEFNMSQQAKRIADLAQSHEERTSVLDRLIARAEATLDILEDHAASLEETIERQETMIAALIKLVHTMTNQRNNTPTPQTDTSEAK